MDHEPTGSLTAKDDTAVRLGEVVIIFLLLFLVGSGAPPAVNEAHYLGKAKHFWTPDWCAADAFLQSADAHLVFNWAFGWTTQLVSSPASAWIGRLLGWILLAIAWQRLSWTLVPRRGYSILAAAIWVTLIERFQMSGEWIIAGIEAKVFAYPLVLFGLTSLVRGDWHRCWLWFGAASSLHVLVGGWAVVTGLISWLIQPRAQRLSLLSMLPWLVVGGLLSLPGLIPAVQLTTGVPAEIRDQANQIYVFQRLSHHLSFRAFDTLFVARHAGLIAVFFLISHALLRNMSYRRLWGFVCGAVLLAITGAAADLTFGTSNLGARILRFYWFRPSDVFVPLGTALAVILWLQLLERVKPRVVAWVTAALIVATGACIGQQTWQVQRHTVAAADRQGGIRDDRQLRHWRDVCLWCSAQLPPDTLVLAPYGHQTFRWYANLSEAFNRKDIPQDAAAIVAWRKRRDLADRLHQALELHDSRDSLQLLKVFARDYGVNCFVVRWPTGLPTGGIKLLYRNQSYAVFRVTVEEASHGSTPGLNAPPPAE